MLAGSKCASRRATPRAGSQSGSGEIEFSRRNCNMFERSWYVTNEPSGEMSGVARKEPTGVDQADGLRGAKHVRRKTRPYAERFGV
jgi:hypothetical protein